MNSSGFRGVGLASNIHSEGVLDFPLLPQKRELELKKAQELPYLTWLISGKKRQEPDEMVRDETTSQHLSGSRMQDSDHVAAWCQHMQLFRSH